MIKRTQLLVLKFRHGVLPRKMMKYSALFTAVAFVFFGLLNGQRIINNSYKKSVFFIGAVVREEHLIDLHVADETSKLGKDLPAELIEELHQNWFPNYVFVVPSSQADQLAGWEAGLVADLSSNETTPLVTNEITAEVASCHQNGFRCLNVVLPMDGQLSKNFIVSISLAFVDQLTAKPEIQSDITLPASIFYRSDTLEPLSAYEIGATQTILAITSRGKSLKLKCPVGRKPEKFDGVLAKGLKGFVCKGQGNGPVEFRFESRDILLLRITKLHRKFTYLPWTGEVQVTESFEFVHEGPKQPESPSFSRIEYGKAVQKTNGNFEGLQMIPQVLVVVPLSARSITVRDEVGIIWTDKERNPVDNETEVVSVPLRFTLIGGMSAAFDFTYTMDSAHFIKPFKDTSSPFKKLINIPMHRTPFDIPVDNFKLTFSLPEDTEDIEYQLGSIKPVKVSRRTYRTYFSTTREKEISFEFTQMTREELDKSIAVLFNYPFWGTFRKPLVALSTLVFLLIGALYLNRLDLSLRETKNKTKTVGSVSVALKQLFQKRKEILMNFEDLIAGNMNTRPNAEQVKSDKNLRNQLEEQLNLLQNAIFEKIKNNSSDAQKSAMNSMALKRLYDEQNGVCRKILSELCDAFASSSDSISSSNSSSKSLNFNSIGSIGNVVKMSQSGSADVMTLSRSVSKTIEAYAAEAAKIDAQITDYEAKFITAS